jgi:hypothetical protein
MFLTAHAGPLDEANRRSVVSEAVGDHPTNSERREAVVDECAGGLGGVAAAGVFGVKGPPTSAWSACAWLRTSACGEPFGDVGQAAVLPGRIGVARSG